MENRVRAEPGKHRLDNGFMEWCKQAVRENKPPQHASLTPKKVKKGGE